MAQVEKVQIRSTTLGGPAPNITEVMKPNIGVTNTGDVVKCVDAVSASGGGGGVNNNSEICNANTEFGTSPNQEKSSNSHPHDSEYDTASDLEGAEEYDDEDIDDSLTDDDDNDSDDDDSETDVGDTEGADESDQLLSQNKKDEAQKKVDEDRSNPQYIPKRGTFYEHDDRMVEGEIDVPKVDNTQSTDNISGVLIISGVSSNNAAKLVPIPTTASAPKTTKNWIPSSAVDRWSHDRFDAREQAPKTRAELVSAYGYDIRTEDAPPKARRRRRYGPGPNKYSRNWEDESAYVKMNSNKGRRIPKPSDFPALNDKSFKSRKGRRLHDDKEYQRNNERRHRDVKVSDKSSHNTNYAEECRDRPGDNNRRGSNFKNQAPARQVPMEFKQKQRRSSDSPGNNINNSLHVASASPTANSINSRLEVAAQRDPNSSNNALLQKQQQQQQSAVTKQGQTTSKNQSQQQQQQQQNNDVYSGNNNSNNNFPKKQFNHCYQPQQVAQHHQQQQQQLPTQSLNLGSRQNIQMPSKTNTVSNLSQRLQQVQNRSDPMHVSSVQMHSLAAQNQHHQQQQQPPPSHQILGQQSTHNMMIANSISQQQQQSQSIQQSSVQQEQRSAPKRYSSLRRSQHEAQHMAEQHQLQQLQHVQSQHQQQQAQILMADQQMLQANLMQLYHQENLQAQMQALQVSQGNANTKTAPNYPPVPPSSGQPQSQTSGYPNNASGAAAYYVTAADAYTAAAAAAVVNTQTPQTSIGSYAPPQASNNYLAQSQAANAATMSYAGPQGATGNSNQTPTPPYGPPAGVGIVQSQPNPNAGPPASYQNYNTVGGTTYFVPPSTQQPTRSVILPQRRPTNAIPILPPTDKTKPSANTQQQQQQQQQQRPNDKDDDKVVNNSSVGTNQNIAPAIDSAENIDHIIDNMFMQRPAFQPPTPVSTPSTGPIPQMKIPSNESLQNIDNSNSSSISNLNSETNSQNSEKLSNNNNLSGENLGTTTTIAVTPTITTNTNSIENNPNNNTVNGQE